MLLGLVLLELLVDSMSSSGSKKSAEEALQRIAKPFKDVAAQTKEAFQDGTRKVAETLKIPAAHKHKNGVQKKLLNAHN